MALILSSFVLCFIAILPLFIRSLRGRRKLNLPPGPSVLPLLGNLHQVAKLSSHSLLRLAREYGPLMHLKLGSVGMLVVSSAEMAEEILKTNDLFFCNRPSRNFLIRFSFGGHGVAFGSYGESWRRLRKISALELYTAKRVQSSRLARKEEMRVFLKTVAETSAAGRLINIDDMAVCLFSNIVCRLVFGRRSTNDDKCRRSELQVQLREAIDLMGAFCPSDFFPSLGFLDRVTGFHGRLEKSFRFFDNLLEKEIEEHLKRDDKKNEDLTSALLGSDLSRDEIKSIIVASIFYYEITNITPI